MLKSNFVFREKKIRQRERERDWQFAICTALHCTVLYVFPES